MEKPMRKIAHSLIAGAALTCLTFAPLTASAGQIKATIAKVQVVSSEQVVYVRFDAVPGGVPGCHDNSKRMAIPMSDIAAKMLLATALTAVSNKSVVKVFGTNTCSNGVEVIDSISVFRN